MSDEIKKLEEEGKVALCPNCGTRVKYVYDVPDVKLVTGDAKFQIEKTNKRILEWECPKCGNFGYINK